MKTSVQSLKDLYVKLGGLLTDTYSDIADGAAVGNYVTIPDAISAVTKKAEAGGGGGGDDSVYFTEITMSDDTFVLNDTLENVYEQSQSKAVFARSGAVGMELLFELTLVASGDDYYSFSFVAPVYMEGGVGVVAISFDNSLTGEMSQLDTLPDGDHEGDIMYWNREEHSWSTTGFPSLYDASNKGKVIGISNNGFEAVTPYKPFIATITNDGAVYSCDKTVAEIETALATGVVLAIVDGSYYLTTCVRGSGDVSFTGIVPNGAALEAWTVTVGSSSVTVDKKTITTT